MVRVTTAKGEEFELDEAAGAWERLRPEPARGDLYGATVTVGQPLVLLVPGEHPPLYLSVVTADTVTAIDGA